MSVVLANLGYAPFEIRRGERIAQLVITPVARANLVEVSKVSDTARGEGGFGSLQFTLRYDHLDLNDAGILGGRQAGYLASLIWKPTDYTALLVNYGRLQYEDAILPAANGDTSYGVDAFGVRTYQ